MRFRKKIIQKGEYRDKTAFLFWPKILPINAFVVHSEDNFQEIRWLETATWRQEYDTSPQESPHWHDLFWIEDEE